MPTLPDKPSELILLALSDLEKCEKDPEYEINMTVWHEKVNERVCAVCFAGSVMSQTLGKSNIGAIMPEHFQNSIAVKLRALNNFRVGQITYALLLMGINKKLPIKMVYPYEIDPEKFKLDMLSIARDLAAEGL